MASKIRVYGQAQNRTALGIVHAYMRLHPDATIEDLRRVFPDELAPDKGVAEIFIDSGFDGKGEHYFTEAEELVDTADGRKVAVAKHWSKPSYGNLVRRAADYDIEVAEFEQQQHVGQKGSYYLEYVNGYQPGVADPVPPVVGNKKNRGCMTFIWVLLGILLLLLLAALVSRCCRGGCSGCSTDSQGNTATLVEETTVMAVDGTLDSAAANANGPSAAAAGNAVAGAADTVATAAASTGSTSASSSTSAAATTASAAVVAQVEKYQEQFDAIEYPVGEYRLKPGAKTVLDNLAKLMNDNPGMELTVNGYASREGNPDANQVLSDKRAATVVDYLVGKGVA
ncbi:MAG: OmpA family protein, partial [Muribaculaceae bacterium]|nr:OmpA family protein [Muribaculaceae bacterium]